ncbi:hypothetical protein HRbin36_02153 [bacterium HR36]|nr:hypothetical protein HRbin36_02153 [bacterium HR36]
MATGLQNTLVLLDSATQSSAFGHRVHQRLFAVNILSRFGRRYTDQAVPVVRRRYHDRVYVFAFQELTEIFIGGTFLTRVFPHSLHTIFQVSGIHITNGENLRIFLPQQHIDERHPATSGSNYTQSNAFARRRTAL